MIICSKLNFVFLLLLLSSLLLVSVFLLLPFYSAVAAGPMPVGDYRLFAPLKRVMQLVDTEYVDKKVSEDKNRLVYGAIEGLLNKLKDPYTRFLDPEAYQEMKSETNGSFGGFGIYIGAKDDKLVIIAPIEDTPASRAGILPGDIIVSIEGKSVEGISLYDAVKLLKGPEGTVINFEITRENFKEPVKYSLKREKIKINSVKYALASEGIGYVRISQFIETTAFDLENAVINLTKEYNNTLKGLILDLRNNPGGLLTAAVEVSGKFLNLKKIVSLKARDQEVRDYFSQEENAFDIPLVLLVNKGSASASEIVSGALQDNKRALIVGVKTYGKGCVQSVIELPDSSAIALTTAWYYTPSGECIHEKGITPDILVENVKEASVSQDSSLQDEEDKSLNSRVLPDNEDLQYNRAYDILRGYNIFSGFRRDVIKTTGPIKITKETNESQSNDKQ